MIRMLRYMFLLLACVMSSHTAWSANNISSENDSTSIDVWIDGWEEEDGSWNDGEAEGGGSSTETKTYTLAYVVDGKVLISYSLTEGTAIEAIPEPKKDGCVFSGWSAIPETMPAEDVTVIGSFTVDSGINDVTVSSFVDVYGLNGLMIKRGVRMDDLKTQFPKGLYIINGKKYMI